MMNGISRSFFYILLIIGFLIGTNFVPAFSGNISSNDSLKTLTNNDENNIGSVFSSEFSRLKPYVLDEEYSFGNYRSEPITIDGVDGEWDMVVPDDYDSIQKAIDNVGPENGYRIFVRSGTYKENVVIDTDGVILHGENKETTIIDSQNNGHVLRLDSSYNNISGFTIQNSRTDHAGLYFDVSSGNQVFDNKIMNNQGSGQFLYRSHANNITKNNMVDNSQHGIVVDSSSLANTITENLIKHNQGSGVVIDNVSRSNLIAGNTIESNTVGVKITGVSENNIVHHNTLIANDQNAFDDYHNFWDDQVGEGNYWDDYTGIDDDGDGIGDTPCLVPGGENEDHYPLINIPAMNSFSFQNCNRKSEESSSFSNIDFSSLGNTIVVPDDYPTIQGAIDHAVDGDRIEIKPGIYYENVFVNKSVSIVGSDRNNTFVDGGQINHVFRIVADNVVVSALTIQNTTMGYAGLKIFGDYIKIFDNRIKNCGDGINLAGSNIAIEKNAISDCNFGIYSDSSYNGLITNNSIKKNNDGIVCWSTKKIILDMSDFYEINFVAILFLWSIENEIKNNYIFNITKIGIQMYSSNNNVVENNSINKISTNNNQISYDIGISLGRSKDNKLKKNNIVNYEGKGIELFYNSNNNLVSFNNIVKDNEEYQYYYSISRVTSLLSFMPLFKILLTSNNLIYLIIELKLLLRNYDNIYKNLANYGIFIDSSNNITILNNNISNLHSLGSGIGLYLLNSKYSKIMSNNFENVIGMLYETNAIKSTGSKYTCIFENSINNITGGVLSQSTIGIDLSEVNTSVLNNKISNIIGGDNSLLTAGISFNGNQGDFENNTIRRIVSFAPFNSFTYGIFVEENNTIINNSIIDIFSKGFSIGISSNDGLINNGGEKSGNNVISFNFIEHIRGFFGGAGIACYNNINEISNNFLKNINAYSSIVNIPIFIHDDGLLEGSGILIKAEESNIKMNLIKDSHIGLNVFNSFNTIYGNDLIANNQNVYDNRKNNWDNNSIGNYWDDYNGEDSNGDGIGDTPYIIPGGENVDRYPLMEPYAIGGRL